MEARETGTSMESERRPMEVGSERDARKLLAVIPEESEIDREEHALLVARVVAHARRAKAS